ncbi:MAG TPA: sulfatase-like hydrolase/transferase, partial [Pyrinomonadaceae bacterium]|nr:sulfatase-like hydrolase/transferase [Pyrinomonadaceae bacterium]
MRQLGLSLLTLLAVLVPAAATGIIETRGRQTSSDTRRKPNVIFVLVDDLGYADIGSYGARDIRTPHLDRLAREGVRLTDCYSNGPVCTPTRAGFITGRYQQRVGLEWAILTGDKGPGLLTSETSIARMLKDNGYRTALFGKWHLGYKPEHAPNAHGFDEFFGILGGNADMYSHKGEKGEPELYEGTTPADTPGYLTDLITERAARYVERH